MQLGGAASNTLARSLQRRQGAAASSGTHRAQHTALCKILYTHTQMACGACGQAHTASQQRRCCAHHHTLAHKHTRVRTATHNTMRHCNAHQGRGALAAWVHAVPVGANGGTCKLRKHAATQAHSVWGGSKPPSPPQRVQHMHASGQCTSRTHCSMASNKTAHKGLRQHNERRRQGRIRERGASTRAATREAQLHVRVVTWRFAVVAQHGTQRLLTATQG
jgi:hypothetical protein